MSLTLTTPPGEEVMTLAAVKQLLRIDHDADDALIAACLAAAREQVEAATGLALVTQGWRLVRAEIPLAGIVLPRPPVQAVSGVAIDDGEGGWAALPAERWQLSAAGPARVIVPGLAPAGPVRIDFTAGFGDAGAVPETLKQAIRLLTVHYYEQREPLAPSALRAVPSGVAALVAPWREVRL